MLIFVFLIEMLQNLIWFFFRTYATASFTCARVITSLDDFLFQPVASGWLFSLFYWRFLTVLSPFIPLDSSRDIHIPRNRDAA